jgi:hypothetical protein
MAQELRSINLVAPAFKGINTEDSPLAQDPSFAEIADNAVIDKRGRIATRKGYDLLTNETITVSDTTGFTVNETIVGSRSTASATVKAVTNGTQISIETSRAGIFSAGETITGGTSETTAAFTSVAPTGFALGSSAIRAIKEFRDNAGNSKIFSVGNNKIISGTTTLVDETPGSYTITADNWKMVDFNDSIYFFQRTYEPLVYSNASGAVEKMSTLTGASGATDIPKANEVIAAYGRLWCADLLGDKSTVYWSDLLIGQNWTGGTSGSIDISKVWPDGYDEIVSLAAHNGLLIIFGQHSIVVYQGAEAPATMSLSDTVAGVGCVDRDTVQQTGTDVIFLSHTGLRSFGRTIQEKSMPISTLSRTITKDIIGLIQGETEFFRSIYSPEENFYLLTFVGQETTFCFDIRGTLEDGSFRVTRWPGSVFTAYERLTDGTLYAGTQYGIAEYKTYSDNGTRYRFKYFSPSLTFGDASRLKILKKIKPTLVGANSATVFMKFAYDFGTSYRTTEFTVGNQNPAFYNVNEFGENSNPLSEFTGGELTNQRSLNAVGSGTTVVVGLEADINGFALSLQEINLLALIGKMV